MPAVRRRLSGPCACTDPSRSPLRSSRRRPSPRRRGRRPGKPAPAFSLPSPDGKPVTLDALKRKPSTSTSSRRGAGRATPRRRSIGKLRAQYAKRGLQVVGIDELDAPGQGAAFQKKYDNPYGLVAVDDSGAVGRTYGTIAMPVHVFIDRRGIVQTFRLGEMNPSEIEAAIKDALK